MISGKKQSEDLVGVGETTHARHDSEHVVVGGVHTDLSGLGTLDGGIGKHKLESSIIDSREVAGSAWLVLLRPEGEGVHVDTSVGVASVVLVWLHKIEIGALTLREAEFPCS